MSADDIREQFARVRLTTPKRDKLGELVRQRKWTEAARLKSELDGPLPVGEVVSLEQARARR